MGVLDGDIDGLAGWVARRARQQRGAVIAWVVLAVISGTLVLLSDAFLTVPLLPLGLAGMWLASQWGPDRWWGARSARAGHPVVRADLGWSTATGRAVPRGWHEAGVPGALHRTTSAWVWRPSFWVNAGPRSLFWPVDEIAGWTLLPLPGAGAPPCAQLRLYLRDGGSVDLLVRRPSRLQLPCVAEVR